MMATIKRDLNELPYQKSFNLKQGDGLSYPIHLQIKAEAATTYSDLTLVGCTLKLYVKKGSTTVVDGTTITADTASAGKFTVAVTGTTTASWLGDYQYEVQATFASGHANFSSGLIKTVIEGRIVVRVDI